MRNRWVVISLREIVYIGLFVLFFIIIIPIVLIGLGNNKPVSDNVKRVPNKESIEKVEESSYKINLYLTKEKRHIQIDLEEYVIGVVAAEMPANFDIEALKAQAVAARTFALSKTINKCSLALGGDICDTTHCQVYMSKEDRISSWEKSKATEYWNKITSAVKDTEKLVLTYNSNLVMNPQYFAVSSGKTENAAEVFASNIPYLKSVESSGEEFAPKYKASTNIPIKDFVDKVNSEIKEAKISSKSINSQVKILSRNEGGSVKLIKLGNTSISGSKFRTLFSLNSANFEISILKDSVKIDNIGYGHGVGMSQWGAYAMAKEGSNYEEILKHYYQGIEVKKIKELK